MENKNELSTVDNVSQLSERQQFLAVIERLATNKEVDVNKLNALLDMNERVMAKQAEIDFNTAMSELQPLLPTVIKNSEIRHNDKLIAKYAKYEDIDAIIKPIYTRFGFSVSFENEFLPDGKTIFYGILSHKSGHSRRVGVNCPPDTSGSKSGIQAQASAETYGKRRTVGMLLNITTGEDKDGRDDTTVTNEQAVEIDVAIRELSMDKKRFLLFMGVGKVEDILARDYDKAINAIDVKRSEQKAKGDKQ